MRGSEFSELQALSAVVRLGSFSAAAAGLRMSRSALSQIIRRLEDRLGVPLLYRSTRSVAPTEAGATLLQGFDPAASAIVDAMAAAQEIGGRIAGRLYLHAQRLGYETVVAPALSTFLADHPDVILDIRIDDAPVDIIAEGFDAGIRLGELLDRDMIALAVGPDLRQVAVASPVYLARCGRPETPHDLLAHHCIAFRWRGVDAIYDWEFTDPETGREFAVQVKGPLILSEQRAGIEAAVAGVGIAFWVESEVRPLVEAGALELLLDRWCPAFEGFSIYYPSRRTTPALRALVDHLRRSAAATMP